MPFTIGMHTPPAPLPEMQRLWRRADEAGFSWISVSDHLYTNPPGGLVYEAISLMTALAAGTQRVQVGNLALCLPFRHPALLAQAAVTIDHVSHGRCALAIGAGWLEAEFTDFGFPFPPLKERLDRREEGVQVIRSLLREESTTFQGHYYQIEGASLQPKPVNPALPVWIAGGGEKRTPRLAARFGDGLNVPFVAPDVFRQRMQTLNRECELAGRDPAELQRSLNLVLRLAANPADAEAVKQDAATSPRAGGTLAGSAQEVADRIGAYRDAGATSVNVVPLPPYDYEMVEAFIEQVLPVFHG